MIKIFNCKIFTSDLDDSGIQKNATLLEIHRVLFYFILFILFIFYLEAKDEKMTDEDPPFSLLFSQSL